MRKTLAVILAGAVLSAPGGAKPIRTLAGERPPALVEEPSRRPSMGLVEDLLGSQYVVNGYVVTPQHYARETFRGQDVYLLPQYKIVDGRAYTDHSLALYFTADISVKVIGVKVRLPEGGTAIRCPSPKCDEDLESLANNALRSLIHAMDAQRALEEAPPGQEQEAVDRYNLAQERVRPQQLGLYDLLISKHLLPPSFTAAATPPGSR